MHACIAGGQELGIVNGFRKEDADEIETESSDSLRGIVEPLASLLRSTGLKGLIGVVGLLTDVLLCVIGELSLANEVELQLNEGGEDPDKHSSFCIHNNTPTTIYNLPHLH